jgi:hypothetical protein
LSDFHIAVNKVEIYMSRKFHVKSHFLDSNVEINYISTDEAAKIVGGSHIPAPTVHPPVIFAPKLEPQVPNPDVVIGKIKADFSDDFNRFKNQADELLKSKPVIPVFPVKH